MPSALAFAPASEVLAVAAVDAVDAVVEVVERASLVASAGRCQLRLAVASVDLGFLSCACVMVKERGGSHVVRCDPLGASAGLTLGRCFQSMPVMVFVTVWKHVGMTMHAPYLASAPLKRIHSMACFAPQLA